jgi:hypothetical protein
VFWFSPVSGTVMVALLGEGVSAKVAGQVLELCPYATKVQLAPETLNDAVPCVEQVLPVETTVALGGAAE